MIYHPFPRQVLFEIRDDGHIQHTDWHQIGGMAFQLIGRGRDAVILMARRRKGNLQLTCDVVTGRRRRRGKWAELIDKHNPKNYMIEVPAGQVATMALNIDWENQKYDIRFYEPDGGSPQAGRMQSKFWHKMPLGRQLCPVFHRSVSIKVKLR